MDSFSSFIESKTKIDTETLHIKRSGKNKPGEIKGRFLIINFIDKETKQHVCYIPSFEVSSYGKNKNKAMEMLRESMHHYFQSLMGLSSKELHHELISLGWKADRVFNKNYSHLYVDERGVLQNFNVEKNQITTELVELVA